MTEHLETDDIHGYAKMTDTCPFEPFMDRVIIQRPKLTSKSGTIIIPDDAGKRNAPFKGDIIAVGPHVDLHLNIGDRVIFGRYAGDWFEHDDEEEYFICSEKDIIAKNRST